MIETSKYLTEREIEETVQAFTDKVKGLINSKLARRADLSKALNVSRPTFNARLKKNNWLYREYLILSGYQPEQLKSALSYFTLLAKGAIIDTSRATIAKALNITPFTLRSRLINNCWTFREFLILAEFVSFDLTEKK